MDRHEGFAPGTRVHSSRCSRDPDEQRVDGNGGNAEG